MMSGLVAGVNPRAFFFFHHPGDSVVKKYFAFLNIIALGFSLPLNGFSQVPQKEQKVAVVSTAEVQLDVVVKDKKGHPIKDLKAGDFEVYEDGVKQQVSSFRLVAREGGVTGKKEETAAVTPARNVAIGNTNVGGTGSEISAVAMVFDRLSPDARKRARDAALGYVGDNIKQGDFVSVYNINLSLSMLQGYTTDAALVRKAIERASIQAASTFESGTEKMRQLRTQLTQTENATAAAAASAAGGGAGAAAAGSAAGAADADRMLLDMTLRSLEGFEALERDQQGYATSNALLALVNSMRLISGRKALVLFSEGVSIPPNVAQQFRSVITAANRANVSIYSIDTAGLRAINPNEDAAKEINSMAARRMEQAHSGRPYLGGAMTKNLERNEDLLNLNPQNGLMQLALGTGGTFIGDTNDIGSRLKQVDEDLHTYYLLNYEPTNQNYDGKFREISVKLSRPGLNIQSRRGYLGIDAAMASPVLDYEAPALALLSNLRNKTAAQPVSAFPVRALYLYFPENQNTGRTQVMVQAPASAFTFNEDKEKKMYSADFSIVTTFRDTASQQIVRKASQRFQLFGVLNQLAAVKSGDVLSPREVELPPGNYEVESIAYDTPSGKAGFTKSLLAVPDADENKLRLSSVIIIQRAEQVAADEKKDNPLRFDQIRIYPSYGDPMRKSVAKQMGFFFTVYPAKGATALPEVTLEVVKSAKSLVKIPMKVAAPDASGRIQFASVLPIESLQPGEFELKITAKDNQSTIARSGKFTIE
jgi:VWFA-related protein